MGATVSDKEAYRVVEDIPYICDFSAIYSRITEDKPDYRYIERFDRLTDLNIEDVAGWLNITPKTYRSYRQKPATVLKDNLKEHLIMLLSLYKHGMEVFGSKKYFEKWLTTPNALLDNKAPHRFLNTVSGIKFIDNRLTAMEFGENV